MSAFEDVRQPPHRRRGPCRSGWWSTLGRVNSRITDAVANARAPPPIPGNGLLTGTHQDSPPPPALDMRWFLVFSCLCYCFLRVVTQPTSSCKVLQARYGGVALPERPTKPGSPLHVCPSATTSCCNYELETTMRRRAEETLRATLQDRLVLLRKDLDTQLRWLESHYQSAVDTVDAQLDDMFKKTYGPFYETNRQVFVDFFKKLRLYGLAGSEMNLSSLIEETFDKLYHIVFTLLNPMQFVGTHEWACMKTHMTEVSPFGDRPEFITHHLEKSLPVWRQFLTTIDDTHRLLHSFLQANVSQECSLGFTKATRCSVCQERSVELKPCAHYCLNVLKGCLGDWADVNEYWSSLLGTMFQAMQKLKNAQNVHFALNPLPVQFSEAIMYFQEKGTHISNMVLSKCFNMTRVLGGDTRARRRAPWMRRTVSPVEGSWRVFNQLLNSFEKKLRTTTDWWRRLPYEFCYNQNWSTPQGEENCWNGEGVGSYKHAIVGDGSTNQRNNPEFQKELFIGYRGQFVEERLKMAAIEQRLGTLVDTSRDSYGSGLPPDDDNEPDDIEDEGSGYVFESRGGLDLLPEYTRTSTKQLERITIDPSSSFRISWLSWLSIFSLILLRL